MAHVKCAMITGHTRPGSMNDLFIRVHDKLPLFKISLGRQMVLYTPGLSYKTADIPIRELQSFFMNPSGISDIELRGPIMNLLEKAEDAERKWEFQGQEPFVPECLTIHVGNDCNLDCEYCYAAIDGTGNRNLKGFPGSEVITASLEFIAERPGGNSKRLTVAYHGSGEPTLHWNRLTDTCDYIEQYARRKEIQLFTYIATNGCLDEEQIDWLAKHIDLIGISCDGPPDIQIAQRRSGQKKYPPIEKVCKRILYRGGMFDIRVTVTRNTVLRMPEITDYLIEKCRARSIRMEPVYLAGDRAFREEDAEVFVDQLNKSKTIASSHGAGLSYSGIRLGEIHGTYCDVSRNTVRVTADSKARNCFCFMNDRKEFITGGYNDLTSSFSLTADINELKRKAHMIPAECFKCINVYHCSRGCPDFCLFENGYNKQQQFNPFRCRLHQLITVDHAIASAKNFEITGL